MPTTVTKAWHSQLDFLVSSGVGWLSCAKWVQCCFYGKERGGQKKGLGKAEGLLMASPWATAAGYLLKLVQMLQNCDDEVVFVKISSAFFSPILLLAM